MNLGCLKAVEDNRVHIGKVLGYPHVKALTLGASSGFQNLTPGVRQGKRGVARKTVFKKSQ